DNAQASQRMAGEALKQTELAKADAEKQRDAAQVAEKNAERAKNEAELAKADAEKQRDLAKAAEKRASTRFDDVKQFADEIIFDVYAKVVDIPGSSEAANLMLQTSLNYLKKLAADAGDDPTVARDMMV